jgi:hypothetical protein
VATFPKRDTPEKLLLERILLQAAPRGPKVATLLKYETPENLLLPFTEGHFAELHHSKDQLQSLPG